MTKRIFKSIMAVAAAVLAASLVVILGCLYGYFSDVRDGQLADELSLAAIAVEHDGVAYLKKVNSDQYRLTWIDADGDVIYDTRSDGSSMENHADRTEFRQALRGIEGKSTRYSRTLMEKTIYRARRLSDGTVLRISAGGATVWALVFGMTQPVAIVLVIALALSALLARRVAKHIMAPLEDLDLEKPLENDTYEELSPLLNRINRQRGQIEAQLLELERKNDEFDQVTRGMSEGLVLLNEKNVILHINPAAMALFHSDGDCAGKDFLSLERNPGVNGAIREAFEKGHSEMRISREGKIYQIHVNRIESDGEATGAVLLAFDITEGARAEENRREFTANVSHELKTPLQSIMGSAELLQNGMVKPEDVPRFTGHIRAEAGRLVALVDDVIGLSALDEGRDMEFNDVDLYDVAADVAAQLANIAEIRKVDLAIEGESVKMRSVRSLLFEIMYNLCDNAVKYNNEGGRARLSVYREDADAVIRVWDDGIGIPAEHQPKIFERFYRVDKSRSKESGGTGLGLSIVKHAVRYLDGRIELLSSPGEGTEVKVFLPG